MQVHATLYGDADWSACPFNTSAAAAAAARGADNATEHAGDAVELVWMTLNI